MSKFSMALMFIGLLLLSLLISAGITWLIVKILIWAVSGFGYDVTDKFWYLFWPIFVIIGLVPRGK